MNDISYTATVLDGRRARNLVRDVERRRRLAARRAANDAWNRPTGFAVVTEWFAHRVPRPHIAGVAAAH